MTGVYTDVVNFTLSDSLGAVSSRVKDFASLIRLSIKLLQHLKEKTITYDEEFCLLGYKAV
jgi:hypothetical protein